MERGSRGLMGLGPEDRAKSKAVLKVDGSASDCFCHFTAFRTGTPVPFLTGAAPGAIGISAPVSSRRFRSWTEQT